MTKSIAIFLLAALLCTGCKTATFVAIGTPTRFSYTEWNIYPSCEEPVDDNGHLQCIQIGGEIYKTQFKNLLVLSGPTLGGVDTLGVVGHAFLEYPPQEQTWLVVLGRTNSKLRRDTGLKYIAIERDAFDAEACLSKELRLESDGVSGRLRFEGKKENGYCYSLR